MANRRGKSGSSEEFVFLGSKITADSDCCHEIRRCLLLRRKALTDLDSILKSRDITLPTKVHVFKSRVFPVGNLSWIFLGGTDTEIPLLWPPDAKNWLIGKDPDAWERLKAGGEGPTEDGWMASATQWKWVWVNSGNWWWTGRPGVLQLMDLQRVDHNWATELTAMKWWDQMLWS